MNCPRCSVPLREVDLSKLGSDSASVVIDICPECDGVWLDKGELDKRDESVWTNAEALDFEVVTRPGPAAICPRCSESLTSITPAEAPGLVLDRCPTCLGFWLDPGELESVQALAAHLESALLEKRDPLRRPPGSSWLSWALHCYVQDWEERTEAFARERAKRYQ